MVYTVKLDFCTGVNETMTDVEKFVKEIFDYFYCSAYNVEVLNVNKEFENELM